MTIKSYRNSAKWQAERAKARGTARTRRAALAMFQPIDALNHKDHAEKANGDPGKIAAATCPPVPETPQMTASTYSNSEEFQVRPDTAPAASLPADPALTRKSQPAASLGGSPSKGKMTMKSNNSKAPARPQPNVGAKVVKKITCAGLLPKGYEHPRASGDLWLADFFCQVTGCKEETYDGRPYMRWLGDFRRVDCSTGEIVASSTAIFPDIASDRIEAAMLGGENAAGHRQNVQIAFRIGVTGEGRVGMQGYAWTLQTIMQPNYVAPIDRFVAECYQPAAALTGPEQQPMEEAPGHPSTEHSARRAEADEMRAAQ